MNKKVAGIVLAVLAVAGSILNFLGLNLLFSDLANMLTSVFTVDIVSSFPGLIFAFDFIAASMYVLRYVRTPEYRKRMTLTYLIVLGAFSLLGIIASVLSGILVYGSLLAPYPFKGYMIICLVFHALLLLFSIGGYYNAYRFMKEDESKRKWKVSYVLYSITLAILTCFAYYRFGAVLLSPLFIQWRTLYLTWPFYLAMVMPFALLVHTVLYGFGVYREYPKAGFIHAAVVTGLGIICGLTYILIGMNNTQLISAVSPVLPLERLASLPIDTIVYMLLMVGFGTFETIYSLRYYLRHQVIK